MTQEQPPNDPQQQGPPPPSQPAWPGPGDQPPPSQAGPGQAPPPPAPQARAGGPPPPPPPPPRHTGGYYEGPWPPEGAGARREGFWGVVWRTTTRTVIIATIGGVAFVFAIFMFFVVMALAIASIFDFEDDRDPDRIETEFLYGDRDSDNELLVIRVEGIILGERRTESWFDIGFTYGYEIKDQFRMAAREDSIGGVLLVLTTPGGTIFGSQAIADGIEHYKAATGKPVMAYVAGISASGGVWSMAPADRILADHGSIIGSVGVIMGPFTQYDGVIATEGGLLGGGVTTTDGITREYITAGRHKDIGNPWRPMTDEERAVLQASIDALYEDFVAHVSRHYGIPEQTIRDDMGAHIFDNSTAQGFGLIDGTASMDQAFAELASMAGLPDGDWQMRDVKSRIGFFGSLIERDLPPPVLERMMEPAPEACFPRGTALAYHGDLTLLCWR